MRANDFYECFSYPATLTVWLDLFHVFQTRSPNSHSLPHNEAGRSHFVYFDTFLEGHIGVPWGDLNDNYSRRIP
jgi:hypothetical protein